MRYAIAAAALAGLAIAAPAPAPLPLAQNINFDSVDSAAPIVLVAAPIGGGSQTVDIEPAAVLSSIAVAAVTASPLSKRNACDAQTLGSGPVVNNPDTSDAFLANTVMHGTALNATTPYGYSQVYVNQNGSTESASYLGYKTLTTYSPTLCAQFCDSLTSCHGFNVYFERDPSQEPGTNCTNPASTTNIKCSIYGVSVSANSSTNVGQWRNDFHVVISGSNGYAKDAPPPAQPGFNGPYELPGAINALTDPVNGLFTYMGNRFYSFGNGTDQVQYYDPSVCTAVCAATSVYDVAHPPASGNPDVCNQVVAYVLSDAGVATGMYCAMYSEVWSSHYATNLGQYRGNDYWSVSDAYMYTNVNYNYPSICSGAGCPANSYAGGNCGGWGPGTC